MTHKHDLIIEIAPDGDVEITVEGIKGHACHGLAEALGRLVGRIQQHGHTEEWDETPLVHPAARVKTEKSPRRAR